MNITGESVRHSTLGIGRITDFTGTRVTVKFDTKAEESTFVFPDAFDKHLVFIDPSLQKQVAALVPKPRDDVKKTKNPETAKSTGNSKLAAPIKNERANTPQTASRINSFTSSNIPSSAIMLVDAHRKDCQYKILIVGDADQQSSSRGIYWKNRELSKVIMEANFSDRKTFTFDDLRYTIDSVREYPRYKAEKNKWLKFNNTTEAKELYIFKQKGIYDDPKNGYELVDAKLYFPQKKQAIRVAVYYQASMSRFFMNEETFGPLVKAHGMPKINLHYTEDATGSSAWAGKFNEQSRLKMLGYSVQQADGMTSGERQSLLSSIIRTGEMTDAEIANHLEMLIHLNSGKPNMYNACGDWKEDLDFIHNNFGDTRKKKDLYGSDEKPSGNAQKQKSAPKQTGTSTKTSSAARSNKTNTSSTASRTKKTMASSAKADRKNALLQQRSQLQDSLSEATGLFNIFKRMRINREIREIEEKLNRY